MGRIILVPKLIVVIITALSIVSSLGCGMVLDHEESIEIDQAQSALVERLVVTTNAGDITVLAEDINVITIDAAVYGEDTEVSETHRGEELIIETVCPRSSWRCLVNYVITTPRNIEVVLDSGAGDIRAESTVGDAQIETGSGDVEVSCIRADSIVLESGSGDIKGTGLVTINLDSETGSGDMNLSFEYVAELIEVETGSGDIDLAVPIDTYTLCTDTGSGDIDIQGVTAATDASHTIRATTGSGDISILGRD